MGSDKTIDQQLQDLEAVSESELLALPEANIPVGLLAAIWERTAAIKEKKTEEDTVLRLDTQERRAEQSKERERDKARELAFEQFQATMHDVQERSERLLERLAQREIVARLSDGSSQQVIEFFQDELRLTEADSKRFLNLSASQAWELFTEFDHERVPDGFNHADYSKLAKCFVCSRVHR